MLVWIKQGAWKNGFGDVSKFWSPAPLPGSPFAFSLSTPCTFKKPFPLVFETWHRWISSKQVVATSLGST
jgi:hypothetical protein